MLHDSAALPRHSIRRNPPAPWYQHHYDARTSLRKAEKRRRVRAWVEDSYPVFQSRYEDRMSELEEVVEACEARGLGVALLEMPLNLPVIGDDFDDALATYRKGCLDLANEHDIAYIRFVSGIGLRGNDFYDLQHLLPSGRAKWQARLSRELIRKHIL
jgi:sugar phosphate isomerase/epimerase